MSTRRASGTSTAAPSGLPRQAGGRRGHAETRTVPAAPVRPRRRPAIVAAGAVLVISGGLGASWLVAGAGDAVPVLALAHTVAQGQTISADDLVTVRVTPDPLLQPVSAAQLDSVVGKRATMALSAGSLLTPTSTTTAVVPGDGEAVVGVSLTTSQLPAETLRSGDHVRIVSTPPAQADPPALTPETIAGDVVAVGEPSPAGAVTVDIVVPSLQAAELAARAATGRVALVLDSRAS